ncbi:MAG TPA: hypothetical protein VER78_00555 [Thermoanaerobaculia bacterium]|nr:hypothetical protein [Thermoanaerobaculia bacterium]
MSFPSSDGLRAGADDRRSAACLKACEGIPTELLEGRIILKLIAACVHVSDHRVREVLEELAMHRLRHGDHENAARTSRRLMSSPPSGR